MLTTMTGKPIGIAMLRCPKCGRTYSRKKECYNNRQASSWAAWMMQNYKGICPECYGKKA